MYINHKVLFKFMLPCGDIAYRDIQTYPITHTCPKFAPELQGNSGVRELKFLFNIYLHLKLSRG